MSWRGRYWLVPMVLVGALAPLGCGGRSFSGTLVEIDGLYSRAPLTWREVAPVMPPRLRVFTLPRAADDSADAEIVVSHYGRGYGGGEATDAARWQAMMAPPAERSIEDVTEVRTVPVDGVTLTIVDIRGTYLERADPSQPSPGRPGGEETADAASGDAPREGAGGSGPRPGYRLIGVVFASRHGPYFIRLVGPEATVKKHERDFEAWLRRFAPST